MLVDRGLAIPQWIDKIGFRRFFLLLLLYSLCGGGGVRGNGAGLDSYLHANTYYRNK